MMENRGLEWYLGRIAPGQSWAVYRDRYLCPCCFMPTLTERARFETCMLCDWEDDGQDTEDATIVMGGPNGDYSLQESRENFQKFLVMYRSSDKTAFEHAQINLKMRELLFQSYLKSIQSNLSVDWDDVMKIENRYINGR